MSAPDELLPCPFCGEHEHLYPGYRTAWVNGLITLQGVPYTIDCVGCGTEHTPREGEDARLSWNRRAPQGERP